MNTDLKTACWETYTDFPHLKENVCFCCRVEKITVFNFEIGHVVAKAKGGDLNIENLRPICQKCNKVMQTKNMFDFQRERYKIYSCLKCNNDSTHGWFCKEHNNLRTTINLTDVTLLTMVKDKLVKEVNPVKDLIDLNEKTKSNFEDLKDVKFNNPNNIAGIYKSYNNEISNKSSSKGQKSPINKSPINKSPINKISKSPINFESSGDSESDEDVIMLTKQLSKQTAKMLTIDAEPEMEIIEFKSKDFHKSFYEANKNRLMHNGKLVCLVTGKHKFVCDDNISPHSHKELVQNHDIYKLPYPQVLYFIDNCLSIDMDSLIKCNRVDILKYIIDNKIKFSKKNLVRYAVEHNSLETLMFLVDNEYSDQLNVNIFSLACKNGNYEIVKYLHEVNCPYNINVYKECIRNSRLNCLTFLHKNGFKYTKKTIIEEAQDDCYNYINDCM